MRQHPARDLVTCEKDLCSSARQSPPIVYTAGTGNAAFGKAGEPKDTTKAEGASFSFHPEASTAAGVSMDTVCFDSHRTSLRRQAGPPALSRPHAQVLPCMCCFEQVQCDLTAAGPDTPAHAVDVSYMDLQEKLVTGSLVGVQIA